MSQQTAFEKLQQKLATLPQLAYADPNLPYEMHVDVSAVAIAAILVQQSRPISYASKTLTTAKLNYTVTEKEMLAIVCGLE